MFSTQTYENIKNRILEKFPLQLDKREGSYSNNLISPLVAEIAKVYMKMGDILSIGFVKTTFSDYLDKRVNEFGVYRKPGLKAVGAVKVEGKAGAKITNGTILTYKDLKYIVLNDITLPSENILHVEALEVGSKYQIPIGTELNLEVANINITRLYTEREFKNGVDIESDEALRERFFNIVKNPATSGNKYHYEQWALEVAGVSRAKVYPLWNGNGTVKVLVVGDNNTQASEEIVQSVKEHIDNEKPIGCTLTVVTPTILNLTVLASVELSVGYTTQDIEESFKAELENYLKGSTNEITYSKIYGLLANLNGVADITSLTLNGATSNIPIADDKIANIQTVTISEV